VRKGGWAYKASSQDIKKRGLRRHIEKKAPAVKRRREERSLKKLEVLEVP